jgi:hypothetical protein
MSLQDPLLSECLITDPAAILALLLKVCESTLQNNKKNMNIPVGRYVSWRPQCSETFCCQRGQTNGGRVSVNKEIVEHFSCYTKSL